MRYSQNGSSKTLVGDVKTLRKFEGYRTQVYYFLQISHSGKYTTVYFRCGSSKLFLAVLR